MPVTARLSKSFYDRFGDEAANELVEWFNGVDATYRSDLREINETNFARFDAKLGQRFAEFRGEIDRRFMQIDQRFAEVDRRFDQLDGRFATLEKDLEARFAASAKEFDARFTASEKDVNRRFTAFEERIERRLAEFEARLAWRIFTFLAGQTLALAALIFAILRAK